MTLEGFSLAQSAREIKEWSDKNKYGVVESYVKKGSKRITVVLTKDFTEKAQKDFKENFSAMLSLIKRDGKTLYYSYSQTVSGNFDYWYPMQRQTILSFSPCSMGSFGCHISARVLTFFLFVTALQGLRI